MSDDVLRQKLINLLDKTPSASAIDTVNKVREYKKDLSKSKKVASSSKSTEAQLVSQLSVMRQYF